MKPGNDLTVAGLSLLVAVCELLLVLKRAAVLPPQPLDSFLSGPPAAYPLKGSGAPAEASTFQLPVRESLVR